MADDKNGLKVPEYTTAEDLVHPNEVGYTLMGNLVQPAIEQALVVSNLSQDRQRLITTGPRPFSLCQIETILI